MNQIELAYLDDTMRMVTQALKDGKINIKKLPHKDMQKIIISCKLVKDQLRTMLDKP